MYWKQREEQVKVNDKAFFFFIGENLMIHYCFWILTSNGQAGDFRYNDSIYFLKA